MGSITSCSDQERLVAYSDTAKPLDKRYVKCYCNFQCNNYKIWIRQKDAIKNIPKTLCKYEDKKVNGLTPWKNQSDYAFVMPTWEWL